MLICLSLFGSIILTTNFFHLANPSSLSLLPSPPPPPPSPSFLFLLLLPLPFPCTVIDNAWRYSDWPSMRDGLAQAELVCPDPLMPKLQLLKGYLAICPLEDQHLNMVCGWVQVWVWVWVWMCMHVRMCVWVGVGVYEFVWVWVCVCGCGCGCGCVCMCSCVCVCGCGCICMDGCACVWCGVYPFMCTHTYVGVCVSVYVCAVPVYAQLCSLVSLLVNCRQRSL